MRFRSETWLTRYSLEATALRHVVWDPVLEALGPAERVFVVADGLLHLVISERELVPLDESVLLPSMSPAVPHRRSRRSTLQARPSSARSRRRVPVARGVAVR